MPANANTRTMSPIAYAKRMRTWGGPAPICQRCKLPILPGELKRWAQVPEHDYATQCVRARAQHARNLSVSDVIVRQDETMREAMARTLREVDAFTRALYESE